MAIIGAATSAKNLRKLKSGDYIVEMDKEKAVKTLLSTSMLANERVLITPHRTLNSSRGVIRSSSLRGLTNNYILDELKSQGVTNVRRILRKEQGQLQPTDIVVITFNSPDLPKTPLQIDEQDLRDGPYLHRRDA